METNKENIRLKKTKIPVPMEPLPLLPMHLIIKNTNQTRAPLKTIDSSNINTTSTSSQPQSLEKSKIQKICFKHCVRRVSFATNKRNWTQNIYEDHDTKCIDPIKCENKDVVAIAGKASSISNTNQIASTEVNGDNSLVEIPLNDVAFIISDDDSENNETILQNNGEQNNALQVNKSEEIVVTPAALIEHKGIRNIKKSLKRPHSRELQGLSPMEKDKAAEDKVKRRLMFERFEEKLVSEDWKALTSLTKDYTDDIFPYLRFVENKPVGVPYITSIRRACIINWLLKINGPNGYPAVIQTACWFLDSFLTLKIVPLSKLQVVAAACYWIAQKLHGPTLSASKLVLYGNNAFSVENLRQTEMKVLCKLNFPTQPVVAQEFITYLSWWCDQTCEVEKAATFICLAGMMVDKALCVEYPSVVAAASVKAAVLLLGKSQLMNRLLMCPVYQTCVLKCSERPVASILHLAIRNISNPLYEYTTLIEHYSLPPFDVAKKIVEAAKWFIIK